jgi:hypothetical protein
MRLVANHRGIVDAEDARVTIAARNRVQPK